MFFLCSIFCATLNYRHKKKGHSAMKTKQQVPYSIHHLLSPLFKKAKSAENTQVKYHYITSDLNKEMYYLGNVKAFKECVCHLLCEAFRQAQDGIIIVRVLPHISDNKAAVEIYCYQNPSFKVNVNKPASDHRELPQADVFPSFYDHSISWSPVFPHLFQDNMVSYHLDKKTSHFNEAKRLSIWVEGNADVIYISPWLYQYQLRVPLGDISMEIRN
jgi:hypothetical protein